MPVISIIIPFINGKIYLEKCIENIKRQKYRDFEIVLIDDGSKDDSRKIIKKYLDKGDLNIQYHYIKKKTIGVGNARNYGIQVANGKYVMFVDVDDYIDENLLENLQLYINQEIDLIKYKMKIIRLKQKNKCLGSESKFDKDGKNFSKEAILGPVFDIVSGEEAFNRLCFEDKFFDSPCLYLIKKDLFTHTNLFFKENMYHEDFGLIPILISIAKTVVSTEFFGYYYIQTIDSIMRNTDYSMNLKKVNDKLEHYKNMLDFLKSNGCKEFKENLVIDMSKKDAFTQNIISLHNDTKENMKIYYTNSVILSLKALKKKDRQVFERKFKDLHMIDNLKSDNIKQFIKKVVLNTSIELYLGLSKLMKWI